MAGYNLKKVLGISNFAVQKTDGTCKVSFDYEVYQEGQKSSPIEFKTCDDCIDFLDVGVDGEVKDIVSLGIPNIGLKNRYEKEIDCSTGDSIRVLLSQVYNEDQARDHYTNAWSTAPVLGKVGGGFQIKALAPNIDCKIISQAPFNAVCRCKT